MPTLERGETFHATTILAVRHGGRVVMAGDGQVSIGPDRHEAQRAQGAPPLSTASVLAGFAGATADAFTLFEKFEAKLEAVPRQPQARRRRARQGLADRPRAAPARSAADRRRRAKRRCSISGSGDVIEPDDGIIAIGSGGNYALAAARALAEHTDARRARHRRGGDEASPRRSASTPTTQLDRRGAAGMIVHQAASGRSAAAAHDDAARDRLRARPLHRRPARRQARGRDRAAQSLAPPAGGRRICATRSRRRTSS